MVGSFIKESNALFKAVQENVQVTVEPQVNVRLSTRLVFRKILSESKKYLWFLKKAAKSSDTPFIILCDLDDGKEEWNSHPGVSTERDIEISEVWMIYHLYINFSIKPRGLLTVRDLVQVL